MPTLTRVAYAQVPVSTAYSVVADVARYPEFLPACEAVEVLREGSDSLSAKVQVAGMGMTESFVTDNTLVDNQQITMSLSDGPFHHLEGTWSFTELGEVGCKIELHLDYAPRGMLANLLSGLADKVADKLVDAFIARVELVHGDE